MSKYAVLDVETTGGSPRRDKITDIAIYIFDGENITDSFESLINPECRIPAYISGLTGITDIMVENEPKFYEIARKIIEITDDCIIVGHNVNFDYNFIKNEFKRLGYNYKRDTIDTVRLSKKLVPELKSHKLDVMASYLDLKISSRHRAAGDARATVDLFDWLRKKDIIENKGKHVESNGYRGLHTGLKLEKIKSLPESAGVYYFYDADDRIIYIGKSNNIYNRVHSHLNNEKTGRALEIKSNIADIDYEITGSELIALLLESFEIKDKNPLYNRAQRRAISHYGIYAFEDKNGYLNLDIGKTSDKDVAPVVCFNSRKAARKTLFSWVDEYVLCQKLSGLYDSAGACFGYGIGECKGACTGEEKPDDYNHRVKKLLRKYSITQNNILLIEKGRNEEELAVVQLENGRFIGFGFINHVLARSKDELFDCIKKYPDNRDIQMIIRQYVDKNKKRLKFIYY